MSDENFSAVREQLDRAAELLDSAQNLVQQALNGTHVGYSLTQQISSVVSQIHKYEIVDPDDVHTIEVTVRVTICGSADPQDVINDCNYEFIHDKIVNTEIVDVNTEI
jgi:hypothetical protein